MQIKLEETKKEFTPFSLGITFENQQNLSVFKEMLTSLDTDVVAPECASLANKLFKNIANK